MGNKLTRRERDVLAAVLAGYTTDAELSEHLGIGTATVRSHLVSIFRKVGARSRTQMVVKALQRQWVREESGK